MRVRLAKKRAKRGDRAAVSWLDRRSLRLLRKVLRQEPLVLVRAYTPFWDTLVRS